MNKISKFEQSLNELDELKADNRRSFNSPGLLFAAEDILKGKLDKLPKEILHKYLNLTKSPFFLTKLQNREECYKWAEIAFKVIRISDYSLYDLFNYQIQSHPEKTLFTTFSGNLRNNFSYKSVWIKILKITAAFLKHFGQPKIALYLDNSLEGSLCDLAALSYDIFVSPLNTHFNKINLEYIFNKIHFNIAVTDNLQRAEMLKQVREKCRYDFTIIVTETHYPEKWTDNIYNFENFISDISNEEIDGILAKRKRFSADETSTVMFTSGSTGVPKGVAFTNYNLITKRFARGAVFPEVGRDEILLCYLPLFHTFGRYLEMLGTIYWGGNYIFAGKNDTESLIHLMKKVKPTGFISIPLRWKEIYEHINERIEGPIDNKNKAKIINEITGGDLRWGLSAAGYLEPKVFKFFNSYSVSLCSGFGMTEATGGISMTAPGEYVKDSVGLPLPGIKIRFSENGELEFKGHYAAKYIDEPSISDEWIKTGDLFTQDLNGHLYIIDRIKEIYKNSKGETIAPSFIEKKFERIPGLKRAFLVGDGKPFNTLLIVPDFNEPFIKKADEQHKLKGYFSTIVSSINKSLIPYERIIKFAILERDFTEQKNELTSKGTFKKKIIETNFKNTINELYEKSELKFYCGGIAINIPINALKDLGITENDLQYHNSYLQNKETGARLTIKKTLHKNRIRIGNFEYITKNKVIDLSVFILQPLLWVGNIELIEFFICKEEWHSVHPDISSQIFFNHLRKKINSGTLRNVEKHNPKLKELNESVSRILYGDTKEILSSLVDVEILLAKSDFRINNLLSRRVEALASHPNFNVRSEAYRILLFNKPDIDYNKYFPAFINSGLPFLNRRVIENIFKDNIKGFNLDAFRRRLEAYRKTLKWPSNPRTRLQFKRILELLAAYVYKDPSSYGIIRNELITWILHDEDPHLSRFAQILFHKISKWFEQRFKPSAYEKSIKNWNDKIVYQDIIPDPERKRLSKIFSGTTFLKEAFMLIYNLNFDLKVIASNGIFVSRMANSPDNYLYRISINTVHFQHYDIALLVKPDIKREEVLNAIYRMIKISRAADGTKILPELGNFRSKEGIISFEFINDLTVWEKIRMLNSEYSKSKVDEYSFELMLLFTRGMAAFFRILKNSNYKIIPGNFSPSNAVVPGPDFMEGSLVLSISGWSSFKNYEDFFLRLYNNFYLQTTSHYPVPKDFLKTEWIFDACIEAIGKEEGLKILSTLRENLDRKSKMSIKLIFGKLENYIEERNRYQYMHTYIHSAIRNYEEWLKENPEPLKEARENFVNNLFSLFRLDKYSEAERYIFYKETYFASATENVKNLFESIIDSFFRHPEESPLSRVELTELNDLLRDETDKRVLNKLIFPYATQRFDLKLGGRKIIIKSKVKDGYGIQYIIRNPYSVSEIAELHKLFILDNYPIRIDPSLQYLLVFDSEEERLAGGVCYRIQWNNMSYLEGINISNPYRKRGLARLTIEDLCERLKSERVKILTTHFYLRSFFEKLGFNMDAEWGGLTKKL